MLRFSILTFQCGAILLAHTSNSTITGYLTDPADAGVSGAKIELRETRTGLVWSTKSSSSGSFSQPYLPPGTYEIRFIADGFSVVERKQVEVPSSATVRLDARLPYGPKTRSI